MEMEGNGDGKGEGVKTDFQAGLFNQMDSDSHRGRNY